MTKQRFFIHIDADAFFASVEQCLHRELRGEPIVTGRDGTVGVALSYEAKRLGVERGLPIHMIREAFPMVQMVASDYAMYQLYSNRMIEIVQQHIPSATRKSIDECAAEVSDMCDSFERARTLAQALKSALETKLWCTFSIGISSTPLLAKMASGMNKPSGLTVLDPANDTSYHELSIGKVTGLGSRTCAALAKDAVYTIKDLLTNFETIQSNYSVVIRDIVYELRGIPVTSRRTTIPKSINRARSFMRTSDKAAVYGQLATNLDHLLRQLRAQKLCTKEVSITLKNGDNHRTRAHILLPAHTRDHKQIVKYIEEMFENVFNPKEIYRYTSVTLFALRQDEYVQEDLFGEKTHAAEDEALYNSVDTLNKKYGQPLIRRAVTLIQPEKLGAKTDRKKYPIIETHPLLPGESVQRRLQYPFLGSVH